MLRWPWPYTRIRDESLRESHLLDAVFIRQLRLPAWIGLYRHEKIAPQTIELDLEIALPADGAVFRTGKVGDTIDYGVVVEHIRTLLAKERFGLVESLAERIADSILEEFKSPHIKLSIAKLGVLREAKQVGVSIERSRG
jgi:7,8-dihydroneopterin aldolase/epimerase/oxygenase